MRYSFCILFSFLLLSSVAYSQHEADYWYFGNKAGLNFSSGNPEPLTNGQLLNDEGCAAISDSTGNLLFYTNGVTVWNKEHEIMENGTDLSGDTSSTQSAIIIPQPGNDSLFYIFTTDELSITNGEIVSHNGLRYSLLNINFNDSLGKLVLKNELLIDSTLEKISAIKHENNIDYWIVAHKWRSDTFYTYLLNEFGISDTPVKSKAGTFCQSVSNSVGYMKFSPTGNKIAQIEIFSNKCQVFDFNLSDGTINLDFSFNIPFLEIPYGCEFSPDGSKLYFTKLNKIFQANMNAGTSADIINSLTEVAELPNVIGALQLANNGKLYIASDSSEYLSVINHPDSLPATCGFETDAIYLEGKKSRLGLPNFIQSYFKKPDFRYENICLHDETQFFIEDISDIDSVFWNFGNSETGSLNTSKMLSPTHIFSNTGIFKVTLTVWFNNIATYYSENVKIVHLPNLNLGNDTIFCKAENYILNAYSPHLNYLWNNSSTDSILQVNTTGEYWVKVQNRYTTCKNSDTINIIFSEVPEINLGNDTILCKNSTYILDAYHEGYSYTWQDNSHSNFFMVSDSGFYFVEVANEDNCKNSDTIYFKQKLIPYFNFPADTIKCENDIIVLNPDLEFDTEYLWQDESTETSYTISEEGFYKLTATNICGFWTESFYVKNKYCGDIYIPNVFTPNDDGINEIFFIKGIDEDKWDLVIYSRWGEKIFHSTDYKNDWKGDNLVPSVYYYILSNRRLQEIYKGTVRIIR